MILFLRTALGTKHESRIWRARLKPGAYMCFLWELPEEAHVVLEKDLNIIDAVLQHREAIDAYAEGEAADFFRVVIHEAVDGGIDHARPEKFNPGCAFAFRTRSAAWRCTGSAAERARDVEFDRRLGEREIAGPEARIHGRPKKLLYEIFDGAGEIAKSNVRVHGEAFDLVKGEGMRGVRIIAAIDLSGNDDAHGRFLLLHGANLHGRSVRAEKERRRSTFRQFQIERVHVVADGMEFRNVERFKIVVGRFDFGAFDDGEANGKENVLDFLEDLADQVTRADGADDAGEREVDAIASERGFFRAGLNCGTARLDLSFHMRAQLVELLADRAFQLGCSRLEPIVGDLRKNTGLAAEPAVTEQLPFGFVVNRRELPIKMGAHFRKASDHLRGLRDAQGRESLVQTDVRAWHDREIDYTVGARYIVLPR